MSQLLLYLAAAAVSLGVFWLGGRTGDGLVRVLLRPAVLGLMALLLLLIASGEELRWPYGLISSAVLMGLWESYAGAYRLVGLPGPAGSSLRRVRVCAAWLVGALLNLSLLNLAAQLAYPGTFLWRGDSASLLDVIYLTVLTFASGGYGDVLPANVLGKLLVMLTSLAGLIYATILFAALFQTIRDG